MSSWFNTVTQVRHVTAIPPGVDQQTAVKLLHGHEFYIQCDPHMTKYEPTEVPKETPTIPEDRLTKGISDPVCYKVTDKVNTIPGGLWDSNVVSVYEFINVEKGVFVRIRSPLSTVMETLWTVKENEEGKLELVEEVVIMCSRVLVGTITSMCESGWQGIHNTMMEKLKADP